MESKMNDHNEQATSANEGWGRKGLQGGGYKLMWKSGKKESTLTCGDGYGEHVPHHLMRGNDGVWEVTEGEMECSQWKSLEDE